MTSTGTRRLVQFYSEAGADFDAWSPAFNMHFGLYRRGLNPFRLEPMLEQMNEEVMQQLALDPARPCRVLDMGCGLGATARHIARRMPSAQVTGVTVVPWQVEQARKLARGAGLEGRVRFVAGDYRELPCAAGSFDAVYAIESACHASGTRKADFLHEAVRALRPGGTLVVADAFREHGSVGPVSRFCEAQVRRGWCLETLAHLDDFLGEAKQLGLERPSAQSLSWRVAPSALYAPLVSARFLLRELLVRRTRLSVRRLDNVVAALFAVALGALRSGVGYYLVSARKPCADAA